MVKQSDGHNTDFTFFVKNKSPTYLWEFQTEPHLLPHTKSWLDVLICRSIMKLTKFKQFYLGNEYLSETVNIKKMNYSFKVGEMLEQVLIMEISPNYTQSTLLENTTFSVNMKCETNVRYNIDLSFETHIHLRRYRYRYIFLPEKISSLEVFFNTLGNEITSWMLKLFWMHDSYKNTCSLWT